MSEVTGTSIKTGQYETYLNRIGEENDESILFLHGSGPGATAWSNWQFALPVLGEEYDCLAPDMVGYGKSEHLRTAPDNMMDWLDVWMKQLEDLLDGLELSRVHLVGNSMGGALALHLLDRHPDLIDRMVLMGSMGVPFEITHELDALWGFYDDSSPEHMAEAISWFVYDPAVVGGDLDAIAQSRYGAAMNEEVSSSFASMFPAPRQRNVDALVLSDEALGSIEHQTLLVHGRDDVIIPLETSLYLLEHLPKVQLHVFGRCRHWIMVEYRDAFNRLLLDFFGEKL